MQSYDQFELIWNASSIVCNCIDLMINCAKWHNSTIKCLLIFSKLKPRHYTLYSKMCATHSDKYIVALWANHHNLCNWLWCKCSSVAYMVLAYQKIQNSSLLDIYIMVCVMISPPNDWNIAFLCLICINYAHFTLKTPLIL